jgi:hypothetical protein
MQHPCTRSWPDQGALGLISPSEQAESCSVAGGVGALMATGANVEAWPLGGGCGAVAGAAIFAMGATIKVVRC